MNTIERKMLDILKRLKERYGVLAIKAEFEAEGSRTDELVMLNEVVFRADMELFIKIGGCEAIRDLDQCRMLGAGGIMAPMIETPFAMKKFVDAGRKVYAGRVEEIEWIINTETVTCHQNLDQILLGGKGFLNTVAIGRVDYAASMGLGREALNSAAMLSQSIDMAKRAREMGYRVGIGGGISIDAIPFLREMYEYMDKFETRKVVFTASRDEGLLRDGIICAMEFETLYLRNKCEYYDRIAKEDLHRLEMLEQRLHKAQGSVGGGWSSWGVVQ